MVEQQSATAWQRSSKHVQQTLIKRRPGGEGGWRAVKGTGKEQGEERGRRRMDFHVISLEEREQRNLSSSHTHIQLRNWHKESEWETRTGETY